MKPLAKYQRVLTWLCLLPAEEGTGRRQKVVYFLFSVNMFATIFVCALSNILYFLKFVSNDLESALFPLYIFIGCFGLIYMLISAILFRPQMSVLFEKLLKIYDASKYLLKLYETNLFRVTLNEFHLNLDANEDSFGFLARANIQGERILKNFVKFFLSGVFFGDVMMTTIPMLNTNLSLTGNIDVEHLYHQFLVMCVQII